MRLTCPSCGAIYVVKDDVVPAGGSHVQCSACHTRWFARPAPAPERLSEEQIIARLETRWAASPSGEEEEGPAPADGPEEEPPALRREPPPPPIAFPTTRRAVPRPEEDAPEPAPAPEPPAPVGTGAGDGAPAATPAPTPLRPRAASGRRPPDAVPPARRRGGGAVAGFLLALVVAALAVAAYLRADDLGAVAPSARPALAAYVAQVDAGRGWLEDRIGPLRARLGGAGD